MTLRQASSLRRVRIELDRGTFRIVGTGRWADFGDAWLCTHDLLHHEPTDRGRLEDEVRTFGVECWLSEKKAGLQAIDHTSLSGSTREGYRDTPTLEYFTLPEPPPVAACVTPAHLRRFEDVVNEGFADAASDIAARYEEVFEKEMEQTELDRLVDEANQARAVGWMAHGYARAQERYPDRAAAVQFFKRVEGFFHKVRHESLRSFTVELDERTLTFRPLMPYLDRIWTQCVAS